jgi:hypothetical protein
MVSGLVKLRWCDGRNCLLGAGVGAGEVLALLAGLGGSAVGIIAWSWERILGRRRGPWVRMGERAGVVRAVLGARVDSGDEFKE